MTSGRRTRQLSAVYRVVCESHEHPSADDVYRRVRSEIPKISLGTVYRNLQKLVSQRQLRIVHTAHRIARYDAMVAEHDHFVCERCGAVLDLPSSGRSRDHLPLRRNGYRIRAQVRTLYGTCPKCASLASRPYAERAVP